MSNFEPKQFGKYYLLDKLAVGGMAEIYKAKTFGVDGFEKLLAIKRILPHCAADKEFITMLIDEAKLSVLLSHANIVQVFDLGKVGDDYFIAMEFINGINLRDIIYKCRDDEKKIPVDVSAYIVSEICKGLDYAHRKTDQGNQPLHIVHRDISPQNVLISYEGEVKIVDFGIAKAAMNISHTMAGILKGKIAYMSPEQAESSSKVTRESDVYSLGATLYHALTGRPPFEGASMVDILMAATMGERPPLTPLRPELAPQIDAWVVKSLAIEADERYSYVSSMWNDLIRIVQNSQGPSSEKARACFTLPDAYP